MFMNGGTASRSRVYLLGLILAFFFALSCFVAHFSVAHAGQAAVATKPPCARSDYDLDSRLLAPQDLAGKSAAELHLLRNEIFAQHCYKFKRAYLTEFAESRINDAGGKGPYEPRSDAPLTLSEFEHRNIAAIKAAEREAFVRARQQASIVDVGFQSEPGDRGGVEICVKAMMRDGEKPRLICFYQIPTPDRLVPLVGMEGTYYDVDPLLQQAAFGIADIDRADKVRELVVFGRGPKSFRTAIFFARRGELVHSGTVEDDPSRPLAQQANGSGTVTGLVHGTLLFDRYFSAKFRLDKNHRLERMAEPMYRIDLPVKMKSSLALQRRPSDPSVVATLASGESVTIIGCDEKRWCMIEAAGGRLGWFAVAQKVVVATGRKVDDVFEGLPIGE